MIKTDENNSLEFASAGIFKSKGSWIHPRRTINTYEIIFILDGTAYICEDGAFYTLKKNDLLILEPNKEHYGFRTSEEYVSFFWLHYRTDSKKYQAVKKQFHLPDSAALNVLFTQCLHIANTPDYDPVCADLYTALCLEEILYNIKTNALPQGRLVSRIREYIILNIENPLSVRSVAEHFGYHENYISKLFKSAYRIPLKKYIANRKLEYACSLLSTTLYTVDRISRMLSFKSENHFIKFFKYHTKITPSQYRNTHTNTHVNTH